MIAESGAVIGIDVGYSRTRRSSAICRLAWSGSRVDWSIARFRAVEPERQQAIAAMVEGGPHLAAAFDGPLRRGFDIIGRYRVAERMLTRRLQPLIGKPGQSSSPAGKLLNEHANACASHVVAHGEVQEARHTAAIDRLALVEAFPSSFLGMMLRDPVALRTRRGDRSDLYFHHLAASGQLERLIAACIPGRMPASDPRAIVNHDDRAAFVCALTALCVAAGDFVAVGDAVDGWIILPPRRFIAAAQWDLLVRNAGEETTGALHVADGDGREGEMVPLR